MPCSTLAATTRYEGDDDREREERERYERMSEDDDAA